MKISYGIDVQESNDPYILAAEEAMKGISEAGLDITFAFLASPLHLNASSRLEHLWLKR